MKLNSIDALKLLKKDVISDDNELFKKEYNWVRHSICVGNAARVIASKLGLDVDYACALGYVHDIGRKIDHPNHAIMGYHYMIENGYEEEASICLTHSFIDNDIYLIAGEELKSGERYEFLNSYLTNRDVTIYDNIIQMCDLLCLPDRVTTLEKRLLDIYSRKGIFPNTKAHYEHAILLKKRLEKMLGCSIYDLFDNFDKKDIDDIETDRVKIEDILGENK